MSITRLQQARQMYAMGKRVGRIAFGGGGSYSSQGGDQGGGDGKGGKAGGAGTGVDGQGGTGGGSSEDNNPFNTGPVQTVTPMDVKEQYNLGVTAPPVGTPLYNQPDFTKVGPGSTMDDNRIKALNLAGSTYKPFNIPPFIPGSTLINTAGNFLGNLGYKKNTQFFADNVAGKYGYGYGEDAYKDYMKARQLGNVNAYGRPLTEGELRLRDGDSGGGIMDVTVNETIDETTDDTTNEDGSLILRYLHDNPNEVVNLQAMGVKDTDEMLQVMLERAKNLYTT